MINSTIKSSDCINLFNSLFVHNLEFLECCKYTFLEILLLHAIYHPTTQVTARQSVKIVEAINHNKFMINNNINKSDYLYLFNSLFIHNLKLLEYCKYAFFKIVLLHPFSARQTATTPNSL